MYGHVRESRNAGAEADRGCCVTFRCAPRSHHIAQRALAESLSNVLDKSGVSSVLSDSVMRLAANGAHRFMA